MATKTMHVCIYTEIHTKLRKIAYEKHISITKVASDILKEALEKEEKIEQLIKDGEIKRAKQNKKK